MDYFSTLLISTGAVSITGMVAIHRCILSGFLCCVSAVLFLLGGSGLLYQPGNSNSIISVRTYQYQQRQLKQNIGISSAPNVNSRYRNNTRHLDNTKEILADIKVAFGTTPEPNQDTLEVG